VVLVVFWFRAGLTFPVTGESAVVNRKTMSKDRICGAIGCHNDADGVTPDGKHTCLACADKNGWKVTLYE